MKRKWLIIMIVCAFLVGAGGTYTGMKWVLPNFFKEVQEVEGGNNKELEKVSQAYEIIQSSYVEKVPEEQLIQGAIQGMVSTLKDPYSVYMNEAESTRFNDSLDSSFEGIGAQVAIENGKLMIVSPIKNSPAEKAGLKSKDQITKIDGESVDGLDLYEASEKIRGEKGTIVELEIKRSGLAEPFTVSVKRDEVPNLTVFSDVKMDGQKPIGYIEITSFSKDTARDFTIELTRLEEQKIKGLIIDVRKNPGGMLSSVEEILQQLVTDKKPYIQIEERNGKKIPYYSALKERKPYPIAILIDEGSASASEILAGALQEIEGYALIGVRTFGKGTVQRAVELMDKSNIKLTMYKWLTPDGNWIHGKGIHPTVEIKQPPVFYSHALSIEKALMRDMNNEDVKIAQEMLKGLGYGPGRVDGYFDEQTEKAVQAFQSINKLPVNGKIDEGTAAALEEAIYSAIQDEKNDLQLKVAIKTLK